MVLILCLPLGLARGATEDGAAQREAPATAPTFTGDLTFGYLTGDYGTASTMDTRTMAMRLRWMRPRSEVRVTLPYMSVDGSGETVLVGGSPVRPVGALGIVPPGLGLPGSPPGTISRPVTESGPGDAKVRGEYFVVEGAERRPWVSVLGEVKAPTGDERKGLGTGELDYRGGLGVLHLLGRTALLADGAYAVMGDPEGIDFQNVIEVGFGASRAVGRSPGQAIFVYAQNRTHPVEGAEDRRDLLAGFSRRFGLTQSYVLSAAAIVGLSDTADDRGLALTFGRRFAAGGF
jgi:hypothetical protein